MAEILVPGQTEPAPDPIAKDLDVRSEDRRLASGEVNIGSETQPVLEEGHELRQANAELLAEQWNKRNAEAGTDVLVCPFCPANLELTNNWPLDKAKEVEDHIIATHPQQLEEAILTNKDAAVYSPKKIHISPKRRPEDFVTDKFKHLMKQRSPEDEAGLKKIQMQARRASGAVELTGASVAALPETMAIPKVKLLDDKELKECARVAYFRGRTRIAKEARRLLKERNIEVAF